MSKKKALKKAYREAKLACVQADRFAAESFDEYKKLKDETRKAQLRYNQMSSTASDLFLIAERLEEILYS